MHQTHFLLKMVSTKAGMRRILKHGYPPIEFIQKAVKTNSYREDKPPVENRDRDRSPQRKDPSDIQDYPLEYQILSLNPPIPDAPYVPRKEMRRMKREEKPHPAEVLLKNYFKRQEKDTSGELSVDEYYRRLLDIPESPHKASSSSMGKKSAAMQKAYAFCVKQFEVMRLENMSEEESLSIVEDLLAKDDEEERKTSRAVRDNIVQQRKQIQATQARFSEDSDESSSDEEDGESSGDSSDSDSEAALDEISMPSLFTSKPRALEAMSIWSKRLKGVPYREWTIGARVALDHWVARAVLNLSEATWQELLEGNNSSLRARGLDLLETRQALFPETIAYTQEVLQEQAQSEEVVSTDKSIEELLATLGAYDDNDDDNDGGEEGKDSSFSWKEKSLLPEDIDEKVETLVEQLQHWRSLHQTQPYEEWPKSERHEFDDWLQEYVEVLSNRLDGEVDFEATRKSLLANKPVVREDSEDFWNSIHDETAAELYLEKLEDRAITSSSDDDDDDKYMKAFRRLSRQEQTTKLVQLSTLRPLFDEFTPETRRVAWLVRHGSKFMENVQIEHFVEDPHGPISGTQVLQIVGSGQQRDGEASIDKNRSYRIEMVPFGSWDEDGDITDGKRRQDLLKAWNLQRTGRARYEEEMFRQGKLGLRYSDVMDSDNEEEY